MSKSPVEKIPINSSGEAPSAPPLFVFLPFRGIGSRPVFLVVSVPLSTKSMLWHLRLILEGHAPTGATIGPIASNPLFATVDTR